MKRVQPPCNLLIIDIDKMLNIIKAGQSLKQDDIVSLTTNSPVWSLLALDDKHIVAGKKDGSLDVFDVETGCLIKCYPLEIKSGVQCIARHSTNPGLFACSTMHGVCFVNISPLNQRLKPVKSVLKDIDVRSIAHVKDDIWLLSINE